MANRKEINQIENRVRIATTQQKRRLSMQKKSPQIHRKWAKERRSMNTHSIRHTHTHNTSMPNVFENQKKRIPYGGLEEDDEASAKQIKPIN